MHGVASMLTGCGSGVGKSPATANTSAVSAAGAPAASGSGLAVLQTVPLGEPFNLPFEGDDTHVQFQVTVQTITCGKPIDPAVMQYAAASTGQSAVTPSPIAGTKFCVVAFYAKNAGNTEAGWDASDDVTLNVGPAEYSSQPDDRMLALEYEQYEESLGRQSPVFRVNPGIGGPVHAVFQIPAGASPTDLWVGNGYYGARNSTAPTPGFRVTLSAASPGR
jgi:hypothetical protein